MNILSISSQNPTRRSQRRKNKIICKNNKLYQIPNPYKTNLSQKSLPGKLGRQLAKLDFLSERSLQILQFNLPLVAQEMAEILLKMRMAAKKQQEQLEAHVMTYHSKTQLSTNDTAEESQSENQHELSNSDGQSSMEMKIPGNDCASMFQDKYEEQQLMFYEEPSIGQVCMREEFENYLI